MSFPRVSNPNNAQEVKRVINQAVAGALDVVSSLTLEANATSSTIYHPRLYPGSYVGFMPKTAAANTAKLAGIWVEINNKGSAVVHHANSAATDQHFNIIIIG